MQVIKTNNGEEGSNYNQNDNDLQGWLTKRGLSELHHHLTNEFSILTVDELLSLKQSPNDLWKVVCDYFYNHNQFKLKFVGMQLRLENALTEYQYNKNKNKSMNNDNIVLIIDKEEQESFEQLTSLINTLQSQSKLCNIHTVKSNEFVQNMKKDLHDIIEKIETIMMGIIDDGASKYFNAINKYTKILDNSTSYLIDIKNQCQSALKSSNYNILEMKQNESNMNMDRKNIVPTIQESLLDTLLAVNDANSKFMKNEMKEWFERNISMIKDSNDIPNIITKTFHVGYDGVLNVHNFVQDIKLNYDQITDVIQEQLNNLSAKNKKKYDKDQQQTEFIAEKNSIIKNIRKNKNKWNSYNNSNIKIQKDIMIITGNALNYIDEIKGDLQRNGFEIICESKEPIELSQNVIDYLKQDNIAGVCSNFIEKFSKEIGNAYTEKLTRNLNGKCIALLVQTNTRKKQPLYSLIGPQSCQIAKRYAPSSWNAKYYNGEKLQNEENKNNDFDTQNIFYTEFWGSLFGSKDGEFYAKLIFPDYKKKQKEQKQTKKKKWFGWL